MVPLFTSKAFKTECLSIHNLINSISTLSIGYLLSSLHSGELSIH